MKQTKLSWLCVSFFLYLGASMIAAQQKHPVELYVETGHDDFIESVSFSPDGTLIASRCRDKTIKLWDAHTGQELYTLRGNAVAFSPHDSTLVLISENTIILWDWATRKSIKTITVDHDLSALRFSSIPMALSPDGKTLALYGPFQISLWDLKTGQVIRRFREQLQTNTLTFSPDGKVLAAGGHDGIAILWSASTGRKLKTLLVSTRVNSIAFSPNGTTMATGSLRGEVRVWNWVTGQRLHKFRAFTREVNDVQFSRSGKSLAGGSADGTIKIWNTVRWQESKNLMAAGTVFSVAFLDNDRKLMSGGDGELITWDASTGNKLSSFTSPAKTGWYQSFSGDGNFAVSILNDNDTLKLWNLRSQEVLKTVKGTNLGPVAFSPDSTKLAVAGWADLILLDTSTGREIKRLPPQRTGGSSISRIVFSPDGKVIAMEIGEIQLWSIETGRILYLRDLDKTSFRSLTFSPDGKYLASGGSNFDPAVRLWDVITGREVGAFEGHANEINTVAYSADGKFIASGGSDKTVRLWDVATKKELKRFNGHDKEVLSVAFSPDGRVLATQSASKWRQDLDWTIKLWDVASGEEIKSFRENISRTISAVAAIVPQLYQQLNNEQTTRNGRLQLKSSENGKLELYDARSGALIVTMIPLDDDDWVVTTPEGRFDTSMSLDQTIARLHWVANEILKPLPLDVFQRQYYEPGLLRRVLAGEQFRTLPSIGDINQVQPRVMIKEILPARSGPDLVDVTVEVESVTDEVSISMSDRVTKKQVSSGAFDLRLFRDRQLVGLSTPKGKLTAFINDAPRLVAEAKSSGVLVDTPEDHAWREAHDLFKLKSEDLRIVSHGRLQYTFRNIKLPRDGRNEVEFTAYAFNADRVKSTTTPPFKFKIPTARAAAPMKGRAFVFSIGVNASENSVYDLRFAANDARKMQEILSARLRADSTNYSEVVQITLISDYGPDKLLNENTAQKAIIKGVFSLLAGNANEVPETILKQIPNHDKITTVEPEDTLIISYSGHGYADESGIFYLLPYDIGPDTKRLTTAALKKMISSDDLSLWMQDITAAEMVMIIDSCHSAAAVQGDGFKPGPMGSRGLGQLAYDKDMKILSATQADNVALELNSLEQGLLSYALLHDGIVRSGADTNQDKQLFSAEWLDFAEKRVPELYEEVRSGKREVLVDGTRRRADTRGSEQLNIEGIRKGNSNLQQPALFDFRRRKATKPLLAL